MIFCILNLITSFRSGVSIVVMIEVPSLFKVKCHLLCHDYYSNWRHVAVARITACSVMHPAVGI